MRHIVGITSALAGAWIGAYAGVWMGVVFQELYRPFADDFADLYSRTVMATAVMSGVWGLLLAVLGYRLGWRTSHAAAFIVVGIGHYTGIRIGDYVGDWYWRYATSEMDRTLVAFLWTPLLWAVMLTTGGYVLGRRLDPRFTAGLWRYFFVFLRWWRDSLRVRSLAS